MSERNGPAWVFLSYSSKNQDIVECLERDLTQHGIHTWRDKSYIQVGDDWEAQIRNAIRLSAAVLYLASPDARAAKVVRGELHLAKTYEKLIYPVWIEGEEWADVTPLEYISGHYIDIRGGLYKPGLNKLAADLKQLLQPPVVIQPREPNGMQKGKLPMEPAGTNNTKTRKSRRGLPAMLYLLQQFPWLFSKTRNRDTTTRPTVSHSSEKHRGTAIRRQPRNPYKGLRTFTTEEKGDFFGRDALIEKMVREVKYILDVERQYEHRQEPHFLTIVGPSGSGKSSVVMAGLLPRLQQGKDILGSDLWTFLPPMRPGKEPLEALAQILLAQLPTQTPMKDVLDNLWDDSTRALHRYAGEIARQPGSRVVLVVDQFEELFTETTDETQRQQFIDLLAIAATEPQNKIVIVVTLRADFSDHPMTYQLLYQIIEAHRIPIPPMTVEDLREVIERPTKLPDVRVSFEENLVGDLLLDIRGQEENLPLLQFTLDKLFEDRDQDHNRLTYRAYEVMGGVRGALSKHAEETYLRLPSDEHYRLAEALFSRLINPGWLDQDATRRLVPRSEFIYSDPAQQSQMQDVIDHFIAARLITTNEIMTENVSRHATDKVPIIEISHEALISAWARLTDWIKVARDDMLVRQALNNDIEHWEEQNKPQNQLYSGHHLARIEALAKRTLLNKKEEEFLKDCKKLKWRRRAINISAAVIIFFLLVGGIAEGLMYITSRPTPTTVSTLQYSGPGSLSQIIHDAKPGSTITFAPSLQGTIYLTSQDLDIAKDLILSGPTSKQITISNHNSKGSYKVHIHTNANATFKNLVFSGSTVRQTSFIDNDGNLTLDNCSINHNTSYYNGGGIASSAESSLTLINSDVHDNAAQGNGGGIYIWQGSLKLNNSKVFNNSADENGGGIYAQNSGLALSGSQIFKNKTSSSNVTSNGGGISMLSGMLLLDTSSITGNTTRGFGGGITLLGSNGFISKSAIIQNHADQKGGGLAVEKNSETKNASLAVITNIEITNNPQGSYWIGHNSAHSASDILSNPPVISNQVSSINGPVIITNDTSEVTGSPAPLHPPENSLQYQGIVNLDEYCHHLYPNQRLSLGLITSEYINCDLLSGDQIIQSHPINTQKACQWRYNQSDIIDRLADYNDPSSWQCYVHEKKLGGITDYLDSFCKYQRFEGVTNNTSGTAYDWKCLDWHNVPTSLSITDACQWHYNRKDAFDRLTDFNRPNGWECWAPK